MADGDQFLDLGGHFRIPNLTFLAASGQFATIQRSRSAASGLTVDTTDTTALRVRGAVGAAKYVEIGIDDLTPRWKMGVPSAAETGANAGGD